MSTATEPNSNKRRHQEVTGKTIMTRVVFENEVASEWFFVQADQVPKISNMIASINEEMNLIEGIRDDVDNMSYTFRGNHIWHPFMLLQETSTKKHGLAHTRYITLNATNPRNYSFWYDRNVEHGNEDGLRAEMHIHLKDDFPSANAQAVLKFQEECSEAGEELTALSDYPLRQVLLDDIKKPLEEWYPGLCAPPNPTDIVHAPMTKEVFPVRYIEDPMRISNCPRCVMIAHERGLLVFGRRFMAKLRDQAKREAELAVQADGPLEDESANDNDNEVGNEIANEVDNADEMDVDGDEVDGDDNALLRGDGFEERDGDD
ncbi:hypothetical protein H2200_011999 [Cladophialophora chaetospira]|uniref:Uncharacterized protein n=1 Tax=Cladophialophora chaetospira TaxID=386627 RepID=A0AA38WZ62_9EURO|nr:hypothetical protein H2200_011999 [Cladophialophora chaetospira]